MRQLFSGLNDGVNPWAATAILAVVFLLAMQSVDARAAERLDETEFFDCLSEGKIAAIYLHEANAGRDTAALNIGFQGMQESDREWWAGVLERAQKRLAIALDKYESRDPVFIGNRVSELCAYDYGATRVQPQSGQSGVGRFIKVASGDNFTDIDVLRKVMAQCSANVDIWFADCINADFSACMESKVKQIHSQNQLAHAGQACANELNAKAMQCKAKMNPLLYACLKLYPKPTLEEEIEREVNQ